MEQDYIFIHIPRTGGRSIMHALGEPIESPTHTTIAQYIEEKGEEWVRNVFKFTVVRNPWERAVSLWQMHVFKLYRPHQMDDKKIMTFEQWLYSHEDHWYYKHMQTTDELSYCRSKHGEILINGFIKFENLAQEFQPIAQRLGIDPTLKRFGDDDRTTNSENGIRRITEMLQREVDSRAIEPKDKDEILSAVPPILPNWKDYYTKQEHINFVSERNEQLIKMFNYVF